MGKEKVAVYARVACEENGNLEKQIQDVKEYAFIDTPHAIDIDVFSDVGSGLSMFILEGFSDLLARILRGEYKRLYIKDFSRLSRSTAEIHGITRIFMDKGVEVICCDDAYEPNEFLKMKEFFRGITFQE